MRKAEADQLERRQQAGLYAAAPNATTTANHGLCFELSNPADSNGLYFLTETGVTPKIAGLPRQVCDGLLLLRAREHFALWGAICDQKYGFYWQADQTSFREAAAQLLTSCQRPLGWERPNRSRIRSRPPALAHRGSTGSISSTTPRSTDRARLPFYCHTGLVYKGLIPGRDTDQIGLALAYGQYSYYRILARRDAGQQIQQTYEAVLECDYRIQLDAVRLCPAVPAIRRSARTAPGRRQRDRPRPPHGRDAPELQAS